MSDDSLPSAARARVLEPPAELAALEERARLLAQPRKTRATERASLAVFERHGVRYAIEPKYVIEVARAPMPTALPKSEPHWVGVTSLHGELIAVADLARLLGNGGTTAVATDSPDAHGTEVPLLLLLVLGSDGPELGLEIDAVLEPLRAGEELARPPHADASSNLIEGVTEDGLRVVRGDLLLADPRLFVQTSANEA